MKILSIQGSPRKQGNTATVLGWVEDELRLAGHEVDHVEISECDVPPCREDLSCQDVYDAPGCAMNDDGNNMFDRMLSSDVTIFASPLFAWSFPAQLKALLDRSVCLCKFPQEADPIFLLEGKRLALVCTAAGPERGNMDLIVEQFSRYVQYQHARNAGCLMVPRCTRPEELDAGKETEARAFARVLAAGNA